MTRDAQLVIIGGGLYRPPFFDTLHPKLFENLFGFGDGCKSSQLSDGKEAVAQEKTFFKQLKEESIMVSSINGQGSISRAANYIGNYTNKTAASVTRLSGNTRFASGADNPAGLSYGQRIRAKSMGVDAAAENMQNSQTVAKIADSAYSSILDILSKARELTSQATNPEYSTDDASAASGAVSVLYGRISEIEGLAKFNGNSVLEKAFVFEAGGDEKSQITISATDLKKASTTAKADTVTFANASAAADKLSVIDGHIDTVTALQAKAGAWEAALGYVSDFVNNKAAIYQDAADNANNVNIATETAAYVRNQIATQAGQYILAQQNQNAYSVLNLLR